MSDSNAMPFVYFQVGPLAKNTSVGCLGSIFGDIIFSWKHAVFIMERVFKLAGKTYYSNASFLVGTGLSALAFTSKLPVNIWKHMFLKGSNDR